jgi:hypothetical protein
MRPTQKRIFEVGFFCVMQKDIRLQYFRLQPISFFYSSGVLLMMIFRSFLPNMASQAAYAVAEAGL